MSTMNRTSGTTNHSGRPTGQGSSTSAVSSSDSSSGSGSSSGYSSDSDTELHLPKTKLKNKPSKPSKAPLPGAPGSILDSFFTHTEAAALAPGNTINGTTTAANLLNVPVAVLPEEIQGTSRASFSKKAAKKAAKDAKKQSKSVAHVDSTLAVPAASSQALTYPLSGTLPVLTLLTALGASVSSPWSQQDILSDVVALSNVRIRTVEDLRHVVKKGWKDLPIPQVVSDRLRRCVWAGMDKHHVRDMEKALLDRVAGVLAANPSLSTTVLASAPKLAAVNLNEGQPKRTIEVEETKATAPRAPNGGVHTKADDKPEGYWSNLAAQFLGTASPAVDAAPRSPSTSLPGGLTSTTSAPLDPTNPTALVNALLYNGGSQWMPPTLDEVMAAKPKTSPAKRELKPAVAAALAAMDVQPEGEPVSKSVVLASETKLSATDLSSTELVHSLLHTGAMVATADPLMPNDENMAAAGKTMPAAQQPQLGLVPGNPNRIRVTNGRQVFEVDRFCPHKQYDMLKAPAMRGNVLTCPKHDWDFDLGKGGVCVGRPGKSLNCAVVSDW